MTEEELEQAVRRLREIGGDDFAYEAKECSQSLSHDVWESVSAFANTEGGTLLLGLSEKQGFSPVKDFPVNKICDQLISGMGDGGQEGRLTNPPRYRVEGVPFEGAVVLVVCIEELDLSQKPCYITKQGAMGGSYKRISDAILKSGSNLCYSTYGDVFGYDSVLAETRSIEDIMATLWPHGLASTPSASGSLIS